MSKQTLATLKSWFAKGLKPTAAQFSDLFDSFNHKDDKISAAAVDGLQELLDEKANMEAVNSGRLADSYINEDGDLTLILQDGSRLNAGKVRGLPGAPGYTPVKGVDYTDGTKGLDGKSVPVNWCISKSGANATPTPVMWKWITNLQVESVILLDNATDVTIQIGGTNYNKTTLIGVSLPAMTSAIAGDVAIATGYGNANVIIIFKQV